VKQNQNKVIKKAKIYHRTLKDTHKITNMII